MSEDSVPVITDEELISALKYFQQSSGMQSTDPLCKLMGLIVDRLVETSSVFNEHEHPVNYVNAESDEYSSAGTGHTGEPASDGAWGCKYSQRIGEKRERPAR